MSEPKHKLKFEMWFVRFNAEGPLAIAAALILVVGGLLYAHFH